MLYIYICMYFGLEECVAGEIIIYIIVVIVQ